MDDLQGAFWPDRRFKRDLSNKGALVSIVHIHNKFELDSILLFPIL